MVLAQTPVFDGATYVHGRDGERLRKQLNRVKVVMNDGRWHDPYELEDATGDSWASISARLRDLRKKRFGGHTVERSYFGDGLWQYRLVASS